MMEGMRKKISLWEEELHKRVIGQNEAWMPWRMLFVVAVQVFSDPNRLNWVLSLVPRPTGVGKTELANLWLNSCLIVKMRWCVLICQSYGENTVFLTFSWCASGYVGYEEGVI